MSVDENLGKPTENPEKPKNKGGRPRKTDPVSGQDVACLPVDVVERIGTPPDEPLERARWAQRAGVELFLATARGEVARELGDALRATLGLIVRAVPADIAGAIRDALKKRDSAIEDVARKGPTGVPASEHPGVRNPAR